MGTDLYTPSFYEQVRVGARASAEVVVPLVLDSYPAQTVVDVGCGEGWWGRAFAERGCDVVGIENAAVDAEIPVQVLDLARPLPDVGRFDLAACLEVAEHLPPERAEGLVADLCRLSRTVLFSAAIPGQGGAGHLNERWPGYWVELFADHNYACSGALRWRIWNDERVENWYRQNLIVATSEPEVLPEWFDTPLAEVFPLVHPVLFDARRDNR